MKIHDADDRHSLIAFGDGIPGIYRNVPAVIYHAHHALSNSTLQPMIRKCPAAFLARLRDPFTITEDMAMGQAFHTLLLEPDQFRAVYRTVPGINPKNGESYGFNTVSWQEATETARAHGHTLYRTQWPIQAMVDAVLAHEDLRAIIAAGGERELSLLWKDQETGELLRGRLDFLSVTNMFLDFKKTEDAGYGFDYSAVKYGYLEQFALYHDGLEALTGISMDGFLVPVEEDPPHLVGTVRFNPAGDQEYENTGVSSWLHCGRNSYRRAIKAVQKCRREDKWPGYEDRSVHVPEGYMKKYGDRA